jgi:hypothetical protein
MNRSQFIAASVAVLVLALLVREWFVLATIFPHPTQGDASAYVRYAMHLLMDGTFSQAGDVHPPPPDAYRTPGYPLLLAGVFRLFGDNNYAAVYQLQALLGTATVACTIAVARQCADRGLALLAGLWLALQPHHIAATGALLTEVLFGLCIMAGLLCVMQRRAVAGGLAFGFGSLVNPVLGLFPLVVPLVWRSRRALLLVAVSLAFVVGWSARNAIVTHASGEDRAVENFVQGAWPDYHDAAHMAVWFPPLREVLAGIDRETQALKADRVAGLQMVGRRLASDPVRYARWYAIEKPFLLWDWHIRMGKGGPYQMDEVGSPLDGPLLGLMILQWALNPAAFALMLIGIGRAWFVPALRPVALFAVYITAVHVVFQAEPRYAIAYRGVEAVMATVGLAWLLSLRTHTQRYLVARPR